MSSTYKYVEYCVNTYRSNRVFDYTQIKRTDFEGSTDCFMSAFRFPVEFKDYVDTTHTVSNYGGKCYADFIYLDFDCENDLQKAKIEVQIYITVLSNFIDLESMEALRISFSGAKGFTLAIPIGFLNVQPCEDFNEKTKLFVLKVAENCDHVFETLDRKIYDKIRVIRLNNTINSKTGLYKIPLTMKELFKFSIDEIKDLAKNPRTVEYRKEIKPVEQLTEIFNDFEAPVLKPQGAQTPLFELAEQGNRNDSIFKIANRLHYHGLPESYIKDIANLYNSRLSNPLEYREIETIVRSVQKYDTKEKPSYELSRQSFFNFEDREASYINYIQNLSEKKIDLGFKTIDDKMRGIRAGNTVTFLAQTGIGKSVIAQNIIYNHLLNTDNLCLFFSIEMDEVEVFERELQIEHQLTGFEIENYYKENAQEIIKRNKLLIGKNNNFIAVTDPLEIGDIPKYTEQCEKLFGKKVDLIIIDYLGLINNKEYESEEYKKTTDNIRKIRDYAKASKIPAVILSQIGRAEAGKHRITLFGGKGSGDIENSSNVILALDQIDLRFIDDQQYRKEYDLDGYNINRFDIEILQKNFKRLLMLTILKNRRGGKVEKLILYDLKTLRMTEFEKSDLVF